jgi:hypothetical protein
MASFAKASDKLSKDGYPWVDRDAKNAVTLMSLYADIDVGKSDTYQTTAEAEAALRQFLQASGMPEPTMMVRSGSGGFHVYWCFDKPLPVAQWKPLAEALKACAAQHKFLIDKAVTADAARILRVPTTFNYKHSQPTPVMLDTPTAIRQYTADSLAKILAPYVTSTPHQHGPGAAPASPWAQNFTANATAQMPKLAIDRIAIICPAVADTLATGGAGQSEPEWANYVFLSAWTDDPVDAAHRLSRGHAQYTPAGTNKKLAEKQQAMANNPSLGWPQCASFGHAAHSMQAGASQSFQPAYGTTDPLMPEGYWRNKDNHVFTNTKNGPVDVLGYPILDGGTDYSTSGQQVLVLKTVVSGKERWGSVDLGKQTAQGICEALSKGAHIFIKGTTDQSVVKGFAMAWMQHLQATKRTMEPANLGWDGNRFVFGEEAFTTKGVESVYLRSKMGKIYCRQGSDAPWRKAMGLVYGNTPLETVVATAFAGPLVKLACDYSPTLSVCSPESGIGKSTAMKLAQSIWGHPRLGMSMLDDTPASHSEKIGTLNNLPVYWDEIKTEEQADILVNIVFSSSQGRTKARLNRDASPQLIKMSTTLFVVASNTGISDRVIEATKGTPAGWLRVFEIQAGPTPKHLIASNSESMVIPLNENYGVIGSLYADFLVQNKAAVEQAVEVIRQQLKTSYKLTQEERFWENTMVTVLAGATLANVAGLATFDVGAIEKFLASTLADLRGSTTAGIYSTSTATSGEELMAELQADIRSKHLIFTDTVPHPAPGRPTVVTTVHGDVSRLEDVWMQVGIVDGRMILRLHKLNEWLGKRKRSSSQFKKMLDPDYIIDVRRGRIGIGVLGLDALKDQSYCWDLTPRVPPPTAASHSPSSPSANFGSPGPKKPAS